MLRSRFRFWLITKRTVSLSVLLIFFTFGIHRHTNTSSEESAKEEKVCEWLTPMFNRLIGVRDVSRVSAAIWASGTWNRIAKKRRERERGKMTPTTCQTCSLRTAMIVFVRIDWNRNEARKETVPLLFLLHIARWHGSKAMPEINHRSPSCL